MPCLCYFNSLYSNSYTFSIPKHISQQHILYGYNNSHYQEKRRNVRIFVTMNSNKFMIWLNSKKLPSHPQSTVTITGWAGVQKACLPKSETDTVQLNSSTISACETK